MSRLQVEVAGLKEQKAKTETKDNEAALEARTSLLDRKERVFTLAAERGLDPKAAISLLGLDESTDEQRLDNLGVIRQAVVDETLKTNGRRPHESVKLNMSPMSLEAINKLPEDQLKRMNPEVVDKALTDHLADIKNKRGGGSLRSRLTSSLFGGGE